MLFAMCQEQAQLEDDKIYYMLYLVKAPAAKCELQT